MEVMAGGLSCLILGVYFYMFSVGPSPSEGMRLCSGNALLLR